MKTGGKDTSAEQRELGGLLWELDGLLDKSFARFILAASAS